MTKILLESSPLFFALLITQMSNLTCFAFNTVKVFKYVSVVREINEFLLLLANWSIFLWLCQFYCLSNIYFSTHYLFPYLHLPVLKRLVRIKFTLFTNLYLHLAESSTLWGNRTGIIMLFWWMSQISLREVTQFFQIRACTTICTSCLSVFFPYY